MNERELNKRRAEWAGFKANFFSDGDLAGWQYPNDPDPPAKKFYLKGLPDFPNNLNACFKWLVSKLQDKGYNVELYSYEHKGHRATIYQSCFSQRGSDGFDPYLEPISQVENDNPALALCQAIDKLINEIEGDER